MDVKKNTTKMFGVTIFNSPFGPWRKCLLSKAQKNYETKFGCYDLAND